MRYKIITIILAFSNAVYSQVPPVCFKPANNYTINTGPSSLAIEDFNNDGFKDVATANTTTGNISILFGSATGTLSYQTDYVTGGTPRSVIVSDFNGDSFKDLAVANSGANNVSILLGSGAGSFSASVNYTVGTTPYEVVSKDFNNDGHNDLAFSNSGSNNISVMFGSGTGTFAAPVFYSVGTYPVALESADFNNDGNLDIVVANSSSNNISVLFGSSTGAFSLSNTYTVGTNPSSVKSSDFNGDGFKDLAVVNYNSNNISILLGSATGAFSFLSNYATGLTPRSATIADFNSDSKMDIAVSVFSGNNVAVFLGNGNGTFTTSVSFSSGSAPWGISSGDIDADGKIDIVSANSGVQGGTGQVFSDIGVLINTLSPVVSVSNGAVCPGKSFTITPSGATTYTYSSGSPIVSPSSATSYTVRGTYAGCVSAPVVCTVTISIRPTISVNSGTICAGSTFTVKPTGASTYTISGGTAIVSPTTTTSYSVVGMSNQGCLSTNTVVSTVTVSSGPNFSVTSGTVCSGTSFTMVPSGAISYTYSSGSAIVTPTTTSTYTVIGRGANTCTNSVTSSVVVNQLPLITVNSGSICVGDTYTINPSGAVSYTFSSGSNTVQPSTNTSYTITGQDANNCVNSVIDAVTVNSVSTVGNINGAPFICVNGNNTYSVTSVADASSYNWILPSELTGSSNTNTILITPASNSLAVSTVSINITNVCGVSNTQTLSIYISTPSSQFIAAQSTVCANSSATISATNDNSNITNYEWSTATQTICSSASCVSITDSPSETTTYSLTVTDVYNCTQTYGYTMNTIPTPTVIATSNNSLICSGNSATLTATGADTYTWSSGSFTDTEVVSPLSSADYTVTGTGSNGCSTSAIVTQSVSLCTGIENLTANDQIDIYPNPANDILNFDLKMINSDTKINVYNALGVLVLNEKLINTKNQISTDRLSKGVYVIKITENNRVIFTKKIVKQ